MTENEPEQERTAAEQAVINEVAEDRGHLYRRGLRVFEQTEQFRYGVGDSRRLYRRQFAETDSTRQPHRTALVRQ